MTCIESDEMTEVAEKPRLRQICSTIAQARGLDPIGGAYPYEYFLILEAPLPWARSKFSEAGTLPQELIDLLKKVMFVSYPTEWLSVRLCIVAPDKGYSVPGMRRLIYGRRPDGPFADFPLQEYLVPEDQLAALAWALFARPHELPAFEKWRQPRAGVRDYFVCTDGVVDRACAVAGMKLYSTLRKLPEAQPGGSVRVWKTSHFGGHVYAATLFTLPDGRLWGFLNAESGVALVRRQGDIRLLRNCYRGWTGAPSTFVNVVERELMMRHGWAWFDFCQEGEVIRDDPDAPVDEDGHREPTWGEVELRYQSHDGTPQGRATARVEVSHRVETFYASDRPDTYEYAQFQLKDFTLRTESSHRQNSHYQNSHDNIS